MSHIPQRKEKDCLNCGTVVQGRYCHVCGQENVVPKETFWHMVTHFAYDITHFDSKFFETIKDLLFKPGFLSREYMIGRRASYLHPIKMYVFTSAIFFLLFFSVFRVSPKIDDRNNAPINAENRAELLTEMNEMLVKDSSNAFLKEGIRILEDSSKKLTVREAMSYLGERTKQISINGRKYSSQSEYDSIQNTLTKKERDSWFMRRISKRLIDINTKYGDNPSEGFQKMTDSILHKLPYMLFISFPLFALLLKFVYFRRKQFYYADHGVFTIHLYVFTFILLILVFGLSKLEDWLDTNVIGFVIAALFIGLLVYLYKAMRKFYGQSRGKTFIKFLLVAIFSLIMMTILFLFLAFFSAIVF